MLNNRGMSTELLDQTLAQLKASQQYNPGAPQSPVSQTVPTLVRRKSLSTITGMIYTPLTYTARIINAVSSKDAKTFVAKSPTSENLSAFFHEVICNSLYPIANVIVLGNNFYDYYSGQHEINRKYSSTDSYQVKIACPTPAKNNDAVDEKSKCSTQTSTLTVTHSVSGFGLGIKSAQTSEVKVTVIVNATEDYFEIDKAQAEIFSRLYQATLANNTLIHGIKKQRNQLILMFELIGYFAQILKQADPATAILQIVENLKREDGLTFSSMQLEHALRGANLIMPMLDLQIENIIKRPLSPVRSTSSSSSSSSYGRFDYAGTKSKTPSAAEQIEPVVLNRRSNGVG